jgi:protocatechuate 3,4-dioxygenase beta subunit
MHYYGSNRGVWNDYIDSNGAVTSFIVEWSKDGLVGNDHSVSDTDVIGTQIVAEQEQKVNNGEVSGTVWAENDYNGLFATDEAKLQDITVQLISDNGTIVATAQTNKLGQYDFTGLAPGNYYVKFTSQSFVGYNAVLDGGNSIVQQASKGINDSYAQTPVFALTYNDVLEKSFGVYVPSTVSGFAWDDANQNGIYDNREAKIANVTITLTDADGNSLTDVYGNPIAAVLTDANGNYSFTNVRPRKEMKLTLTSSNTVDISNARVSPIPASGDVKLTNKAEKSIGMLEFNGAPTSATTEKSGSMLTSATIGEIYINSMSGTGITPVNAEYKNFALSANNSIRGYVWVESDYNGILDGWHETQADIDIEEPVLNGVKVTLKNAAGATVATTYTDFAGYYEFLALKPGLTRSSMRRQIGPLPTRKFCRKNTIILDSPFLQQQPPIKRLRWATIPRLSCRTTR